VLSFLIRPLIYMMLYNSPMEQFLFCPLHSLFSSNSFVFTIIPVIYTFTFLFIASVESHSIKGFSLSQNLSFFSLIAIFFKFIKSLCVSVLGPVGGLRFYPFFCSVFFFIFVVNLIAIVPYSFSITSHLSVTISLSCSLLLGVVFVMFNLHGKLAFTYFLPSGTPFLMAFFIVPLEVISYFVRFISLPIRLFANMMSGHILLKVFIGLASALFGSKSLLGFLVSFIPLVVLSLLLFLEVLVAFVQAYVFCLLLLIFLSDAHGLH
jgi:ATP synthase subunit 6